MPLLTRASAPADALGASARPSGRSADSDWSVATPRRAGKSSALWWSLALITLLCSIALFAPALAPYSPNEQLDIIALKSQPPSLAHPLGPDQYSRDLLSRMLF